jgi:hypothetical protein
LIRKVDSKRFEDATFENIDRSWMGTLVAPDLLDDAETLRPGAEFRVHHFDGYPGGQYAVKSKRVLVLCHVQSDDRRYLTCTLVAIMDLKADLIHVR